MGPKMKKILSSTLALMLALVFVAGASEVVEMLGFSPVTEQVLGSGNDYVRPTIKYPNKLTVGVKKKTVNFSAAKLMKKNQSIARKSVIAYSNAQGKVTFKKVSGDKKITVSAGKITVKKGLKKGTYPVKVKISAAGNDNYKAGSKTVSFKIKVKKAENTLKVSAKTVDIDAALLVDAPYEIKRADALSVTKAKGKVTYVISDADPAFTINKSSGNITVAAGLAPGEYKVKVKVKAAGNSGYTSETKTKTVTVNVKQAESESGTGA